MLFDAHASVFMHARVGTFFKRSFALSLSFSLFLYPSGLGFTRVATLPGAAYLKVFGMHSL
jgi:hypothetical protein